MILDRRTLLTGLALAPSIALAREAASVWTFDFQTSSPKPYDPAAGHGWEPGPGRLFSVKVPEGDYRVALDMGGDQASETTIKAEARRLMLESVRVGAGETETRTIIVNVRRPDLAPPPPNAPGGTRVLLNPREDGSYAWDDKLTLEFCGPTAAVRRLRIEPVTVPTVFLAGDSTVTDQRFEPAAGWGQMLPRFFKPEISVANHAESGETLKSFLIERRLDKILSRIKPGDWLLIQFGHNDQKTQWPQTYAEAATTYRDYLRVYAGEARRRGATPVFVTSMHRHRFDAAGKVVDTLGDYPKAMRETAGDLGAPLIDLHAMSAAFYEALGPKEAWKAFNDGGKDLTHHNNYGAYQLARCVVEGVRTHVPDLAAHLAGDLPPFDPARPPSPDAFTLPPSAVASQEQLRGN
ncbi:rhamnogalacturonan acetylesterase [Caulobacter segnis]|uniref:Lipolytic protein G-D-S-L family n=2 Tax=Caulobacter segnis TaxID=88688 RepID=D5VL06_CAUST|nr:rhamnogalacturonan acetylesterase [Caulobacter segnis]ADG11179.1 lipolytic protein G-D-S-L family [Caulobacter segnis ATCC 21756]AVQ02864.1 rhamnogalacturonan acetylesterase [Caulobacter segnis]